MRIYSWYSLPVLKHYQQHVIRIASLNVPEMAFWALFGQFYQMVTMETMAVRNILISVLAMYFQVL